MRCPGDQRQAQCASQETPELFGVFSKGRSGSTWLGSIINTHPDIAYRFEPFHRLRGRPEVAALRRRIESGRMSQATREGLYELLLPADPLIDRPPFFRKDGARLSGKKLLWPAARQVRTLAGLYRALYTPKGRPVLVFKEVALEALMAALVQSGDMGVVYLVRHPCAVVASQIRGQEAGVMPTARQSILANLLEEHDPALADRVAAWRAPLAPHEREALLWRIDVERGLRAIASSPKGMLVIYEDLCRRPIELTTEIFAHIGLEVPPETIHGLREMTSNDAGSRRHRGERWSDPYFSVFRDPSVTAEQWRRATSAEQQRSVLAWVSDSPAFQHCRAMGLWDEKQRSK